MESSEDLFERLKKLVEESGTEKKDIRMETKIEELDLDSVNLTSLLLDIEEQFNVLVTDEIWVEWEYLRDVIEYVDQYLSDAPSTIVADKIRDKEQSRIDKLEREGK